MKSVRLKGISEKCAGIKRYTRDMNSILTLYEEPLKEKFGSELIDELLIESKSIYLRFEELENSFFKSGY